MRTNGVEAAIARYREAGTKKYAHNRNCAQMGSAQLGVLLPRFEVLSFFLMDSVSLGIADDQTESWNFVSVEQFKI